MCKCELVSGWRLFSILIRFSFDNKQIWHVYHEMTASPVEPRQHAQTFSNDIVNFTSSSAGRSLVRWVYTNLLPRTGFIFGSSPTDYETSEAEKAAEIALLEGCWVRKRNRGNWKYTTPSLSLSVESLYLLYGKKCLFYARRFWLV